MSEYRHPLDSPEAFSAYCEHVKEQLKTHVADRISFLESAHAHLGLLEGVARKAGSSPLLTELELLGQHARREAVALRESTLLPASELNGAALLFAPSSTSPAIAPTHAAIPDAAQPAEYRTIPTASAAYDARTPYEARGPRPAAPLLRPTPPVPKTEQRNLEELYHATDALIEEAEQEGGVYSGVVGLIRLKALLCRQRGLQAELFQRDIQHWPLKQLLTYIRRRIDEEHGSGHYLIMLRAELWPAEPWPWYMLADLYDGLIMAYESLDWYEEEASKFNQPERQELLESIAAHQTRLWRHLQAYFPRQNDEHQLQFFRSVCALAEQEDVYLYSLQERCPDEVLKEKAESLPVIIEHLKLDRTNRAKREASIQELKQLVTNPDFGTRDSDPKALEEAVLRCRDTGAAASSTALRSLLIDWVALLTESKKKAVQEVARELEREVERLARKAAEAEVTDGELGMSDAEYAELEAVREQVRGKKCLFIGGICREESRQRIERELGLAELVWPSTTGTESVYNFEADIQNTDITVILIRFMRTGWGQARELAQKHNKLFVRMPAGYGVNQVVRQFYRQILHEEPVLAGK
jgi:hypothetical protein